MQLASFLEDPQYQDQYSLHTEIIKTFGRVGPNAEPRFRDECKLHFFTLFPELTCKSKTISFSEDMSYVKAFSALCLSYTESYQVKQGSYWGLIVIAVTQWFLTLCPVDIRKVTHKFKLFLEQFLIT